MKFFKTYGFALVLASLFSIGCAGTPKEFVITQAPANPGVKEYPKADVIVLLRSMKVQLSEDGHTFTSQGHVQYKALTQKGTKRLRKVGVDYSSNHKLTNLRARLVRPNGWISKAPGYFDLPSMRSSNSFSDYRQKGTRFRNVVPGSVLEFRYTHTGPTWFLSVYRFQNTWPVAKSVYSLSIPQGIGLKTQLHDGLNFAASRIKFSKGTDPDNSKNDLHRWEASGIPAMKKEGAMPFWPLRTARLDIAVQRIKLGKYEGSLRDWNSFAEFYSKIVGTRATATDYIKTFTKTLLKDAKNEDDKIRKIYDFVRKDIRYIAVNIGLGGWQPQSAEFTLKQRYGDCKAKATLLKAMLSTVGIEALPVLVRTRYIGKLDKNFPSNHFNHVINYLPKYKGGLFVDATTNDNRLELLRADDQGASALIIEGNKGRFVTIPAFDAEKNLKHRKLIIRRSKDGLTGTLIVKLGGIFRARLDGMLERKKLSTSKDKRKWGKTNFGYLGSFFSKLSVTKVTFSGQNTDILTANIDFVSPALHDALIVGKNYLLDLRKFRRGSAGSALLKKRKYHPALRNKLDKYVDELELQNFYPMEFPSSFSTKNKHLEYQLRVKATKTSFSYSRKLKYLSDEIPLADHKSFREAFSNINQHETHLLVFTNKAPKPKPKPRPKPVKAEDDKVEDADKKPGSKGTQKTPVKKRKAKKAKKAKK